MNTLPLLVAGLESPAVGELLSQLAVCRELCGQGRRRLERPGEWKLLHRLLRRRHLLHLLRRSTPRLMRPSRRRLSSGGGRRESWLHSC